MIDVDGPILDGRLRHYTCYSEILRRHGYEPVDIEEYWRAKRRPSSLDEQLQLSSAAAIVKDFRLEWADRIEDCDLLSLDVAVAGALERVASWRRQGSRILFATHRRYGERVRNQLLQIGVATRNDDLVTADPAGGARAKAHAVRERLPRADWHAAIWIGDTEADANAARLLGCRIWLVTCGLRDAAYLETLSPDVLSASLANVDLSALE